jgi:hypothetical protein
LLRGSFVKRVSDRWQNGLLSDAAPVLVAMLVAALSDHIASDESGWVSLAWRSSHTAILLAPALAAHLAACHWRPWMAALAWIGGFILYPLVLTLASSGATLPVWQWVLAAGFSLAFLLLHSGAGAWSHRQRRSGAPILSLPITLDGTIAVLLALWALGATSLFSSTSDAVRNQPLSVWVNWRRIASEPGETLGYLAQFGILAVAIYGWYWICRYVLVRKVLRRHGIVPFAYAVVTFVALGTPVAGGIGLLMPLNIPQWTAIPSENHNPFDWDNFRFTIWLTAIILPLVLTVERLLAEQAEAGDRHERVRAELQMLQQQINPHFLFNTLNTLYALCLKDRAESASAVIKLSDLLRYAVYNGQAPLNILDEEIAYLKNYLDLQVLRFGHRCSLHTDWPEAETGLALPPMLLIMLVENAFKHGVEPVEGACEVRITLAVDGRRMRFDCDNSVPTEQLPGQPGLGLANLRRRLELLFGPDFRLITDDSDGLWRARLELELEPC